MVSGDNVEWHARGLLPAAATSGVAAAPVVVQIVKSQVVVRCAQQVFVGWKRLYCTHRAWHRRELEITWRGKPLAQVKFLHAAVTPANVDGIAIIGPTCTHCPRRYAACDANMCHTGFLPPVPNINCAINAGRKEHWVAHIVLCWASVSRSSRRSYRWRRFLSTFVVALLFTKQVLTLVVAKERPQWLFVILILII